MNTESPEMVSTLSYRLYEDKDTDGILELWEKYSGWGGITLQQFNDWYVDTPYGPCMIVVAEHEGAGIIGQMIFVPAKLWRNEKESNTYRVMAPIVSNNFRAPDIKDFHHPVYAMFRFGIQEAVKKGYDFFYFLPSIGWITAVKTFPRYGLPQAIINVHDCLQIDVTADYSNIHNDQYYIQEGHFNEEYDKLWQDSIGSLPIECAIARRSKWLKWKRAGQVVFEMRNRFDRQLKGFIVIKKEHGLVIDLLAGSIQEMSLMLQLTLQQLYKNNTEEQGAQFEKIKLMQTEIIQNTLLSIPHYKIDFRFAAVYFSSTENMSENKKWLIMPDD